MEGAQPDQTDVLLFSSCLTLMSDFQTLIDLNKDVYTFEEGNQKTPRSINKKNPFQKEQKCPAALFKSGHFQLGSLFCHLKTQKHMAFTALHSIVANEKVFAAMSFYLYW